MHFRDRKSPVFHHTVVRISSTSMIHLERGTGTDEFCGSCLISFSGTVLFPVISGFNPREDDAKFLEFSKRAEGSFSGTQLSETFLEVPKVFRASCGNPESRQGIFVRLGIAKGGMGTWHAPMLLAASGSYNYLASDKEFTVFCIS